MFNIFTDEDFIQFKMSSELKYVSRVVDHVRNFLKQNAIEEENNIPLILRELINNAMEHGNKGNPSLKVFCSIEKIEEYRFKIVVEDEGAGFDHKSKFLTLPEDPRQVRNRGLCLVNSFSDELVFSEKGNIVTVYVTIQRETTFSITMETDVDGNSRHCIRPSGDITAENAEKFRSVLLDLFDCGSYHFLFDLSEVEDIDSLGLSIFVIFSNMLHDQKIEANLQITGASDNIRNLIRMTHLDRVYQMVSL